MPRIVVLVDGFNLYHSIADHPSYRSYKWLDIRKLLVTYFPKGIEKVFYFTAPTPWDPGKVSRHKILIKALESTGIEVVYGKFKERDRTCPSCGKRYKSREEKQTDVNIAITLLRAAFEGTYDEAVLLTGDSDQLPALREVHRFFPRIRLGVVIPIGREARELELEADFHIRIKERVLQKSLFGDPVVLADGSAVNCPSDWK